nr:ADP-ribosylation factor-like protein [Candidatus Sigynarchaeota archaeon]
MGLFDMLRRKSDKKAVFLGLDNSGKSTIISFLQEGHFVPHTPTMGKKKIEMDVVGTRMSLFDMGGQEDFRNMWLGELKNAKVTVFVIDGVDRKRFGEAKAELKKIIPSLNRDSSLLVLVNKRDVYGCASIGEIIEAFGLLDIDNFEIMDISAKTGYNMANTFAKFY